MGLPVVRLMLSGESNDPDLKREVMVQLRAQLGRESLGDLKDAVKGRDEEQVRKIVDKFQDDYIKINSMRLSRSISGKSNSKVVVRVEYTLGPTNHRTQYYAFRQGILTGWSWLNDADAVSYYLNFL
jgi:hypothetical protein